MSDGDSAARVRSWIEQSGRALELRVARALRVAGSTQVQIAHHYRDAVTSNLREADVIACFSWTGLNGTECTITLSVECKSSSQYPWVGFLPDAPPAPRPDLADWASFAHGPFTGITDPLPALWIGQSPFTEATACTHVAVAHAKESVNPANDALRQVLSSAAAVRRDYLNGQGRVPRVGPCMPPGNSYQCPPLSMSTQALG